jgi:hypothetical protein
MERHREGWEQMVARLSDDESAAIPPLDEKGGIGFDPRRDPHPSCPECFGEGIGEVFVKDTRKLTPEERALYGGAKLTKNGLEVKLHDKQAALVNVGRHLGMFTDKVEVGARMVRQSCRSSTSRLGGGEACRAIAAP